MHFIIFFLTFVLFIYLFLCRTQLLCPHLKVEEVEQVVEVQGESGFLSPAGSIKATLTARSTTVSLSG